MTKYSVNHRIYLSSFGTQRPAADAARSRQAISMMGLLTFVIKNPLTSASIAAGCVAVGYAGYYAYKTGSRISWATSPKTYIQASQEILEDTADVATNVAKKVSSVPGDIAEKVSDIVDSTPEHKAELSPNTQRRLKVTIGALVMIPMVIGGALVGNMLKETFWPLSE